MGTGENEKGGNRYGVEKTVGRKESFSESNRKRRQQGEEWAGLWRGEGIGKGGSSYGVGTIAGRTLFGIDFLQGVIGTWFCPFDDHPPFRTFETAQV